MKHIHECGCNCHDKDKPKIITVGASTSCGRITPEMAKAFKRTLATMEKFGFKVPKIDD